jgi:putative addiction module component (TIGR02574 family)
VSERNAQLKAALAALSFEDREEMLAYLHELQDRDEPPLTQEEWQEAWIDEINSRVSDAEAGRSVGMPVEEFMAKMKAKHGC